jgi:hypothetical protein
VHADQLALLLLEGRPALAKPLAGAAPYSPGVAELARWRLRKLGAWFP